MIGLVLALVVAAILVTLFGGWMVGIAIAVVALALCALFLVRFSRRAAKSQP
jgi:membrane protein implicated in regulation of membrane protease activity